jgi:DNA polymerase-4
VVVTVDRSMELEPAVLHVDMDAFFASVELLDHPELVGKPVIVGGTGHRGVVASCTYEARRFGVHSAMPMFRARDLCPHAIVLDGRHNRYGEVSEQIHEIFRSITPLVEPIGLDEAFLDVTGSRRLFGSPLSMARSLRERIAEQLSLLCSVGVGRSKLIAKLASESAKPKVSVSAVEIGEGVCLVMPDDELAFLHPMRVEALWGVGPATARRLHGLGITTVGNIADLSREVLVRQFGRAHGEHLYALAMGRDPAPVDTGRVAKSIGHEQTFAHDITDPGELRARVVALSDALSEVLARQGLCGRTVTLKVRFGDFTTLTRSHTLELGIDAGAAIAAVSVALLDVVDLVAGVRLLGVSVSGLAPTASARQLSFALTAGPEDPGLGGSAQDSWEEVARAVAAIRGRFGRQAVGPASTVSTWERPPEWWGPSSDEERR